MITFSHYHVFRLKFYILPGTRDTHHYYQARCSMKKFLSILCLLSLVALLSACNNGDNGSKGSTIPDVSWDLFDTNDWVTCYNADKSVVTNPYQTCEWNCASLDGSPPRYYKVTFLYDEATDEYSVENIQRGVCRL